MKFDGRSTSDITRPLGKPRSIEIVFLLLTKQGLRGATGAREEGRGLTREVRLDLAVGSGLCGSPQAERREERERPGGSFEDRNIRRRYRQRYRYTLNGWAIKRALNAAKLDRRSVYTIIRMPANLQPIVRTFLCHL